MCKGFKLVELIVVIANNMYSITVGSNQLKHLFG